MEFDLSNSDLGYHKLFKPTKISALLESICNRGCVWNI